MSKRKDVRPRSAPQRRQQTARRPTPKIIGLVVAAAVVLAGAVIFFSLSQSAPAAPAAPVPVQSSAGDVAMKGPDDAKVTIVEYSDFQCPYCGRFALTAGRSIDEQYVGPGKVRFIYRNQIVIGEESVWAGEAALCAGEQGQFWSYHDKLFSSQAGENKGAFAKANLKRFAQALGLEPDAFGACLDGGKYRSRVLQESSEGAKLGVQSTPTFFVNSQRILGAQPFEAFRNAIEAELRRAN